MSCEALTARGTPRRRARRRTPLRRGLTTLLAVACASARPAADETLVAPVDLLGWRRAGTCAVDGTCWDDAALGALLDDDRATVAVSTPGEPLRWTVSFAEPLRVRGVALAAEAGEVGLTVVESDGGRFAAGRERTSLDAPATFELRDVEAVELRFDSSLAAEGRPIRAADLTVIGEATITALELVGIPATLPERGSFPVVVRGRDERGGRPVLTSRCRILVTPERALEPDGGRLVARVGGPVTVSARLGTLVGGPASLLVEPLAEAPPAPALVALPGQVAVTTSAAPPVEVLRRRAGDTDAEPIATSLSPRFVDTTASPGAAYQYSVRRVDAFGNPVGAQSPVTRARVPARIAASTTGARVLPMLVTFAPADVGEPPDAIAAAVDAARTFVYRATRGALWLDVDLVALPGASPATTGPSMHAVEERLRRAGVPPGRHAFVFAVVPDASTGYSGFTLLGGAAGGFGPPRGTAPVAPPGSLGPLPALTWTLLHELNHALELDLGPAGGLDGLPTHHLAEDFAASRLGVGAGRPFDAGDGWDGLARIFATFPDWSALGAPLRDELALDTDGDGLADDAPHLPVDEARLGTDPARSDSDDDGLDDLAEWCAGLYRGADPLVADTDGDGLLDGEDPHPLVDVAATIPHGTTPQRIAGSDDITLAASWTSDALHLAITTDAPSLVFVDVDGSGALGRWESDARVAGGSDVFAGDARIAIRAFAEPRGVFVGRRPVEAATVETSSDGRRTTVRVTLPAGLGPGAPDVFVPDASPTADGLRLEAGRALGLAVTARLARTDDPAPFEPFVSGAAWTSLFEPWVLVDVELATPEER